MSDEKPALDERSIADALGVSPPPPSAAARFVDPRPTDVEIFFALLPQVIGGLASKGGDLRFDHFPSAFIVVREALGQCAAMGTLCPTFVCIDGLLS